jgi:hypothetical protein
MLGWGVPMALVSKAVESVLDTLGITQVDAAPSHGAALLPLCTHVPK